MKTYHRCYIGCLFFTQFYWIVSSDDHLGIIPSGEDYKLAGSSLQINCSIYLMDMHIERTQLRRCYPGGYCNTLQSYPIDNKTISYNLSNTTVMDSGTYCCTCDEDEDCLYLVIDDLPEVPSEIDCSSLNREQMVCSWNISAANQGKLKVNWTTSFIVDIFGPRVCPKLTISDNIIRCEWPSSSTVENMFDFQSETYFIYLKGRNILGEKKQQFRVNISQIVKLTALMMSVSSKTSRNISLHWVLPDEFYNTSLNLTCVYRLSFRSKWDLYSKQVEFVKTGKDVFYTVNHLVPYTHYSISLSGRPIKSITWSDETTIDVKTESTVPENLPQMHNALYYFEPYNSQKRKLTIFLRPMDQKDSNSFFANYCISLWEANSTGEILTQQHNVSYTAVTIDFIVQFDTFTTYRVSVRAYNDVGYSTDSTEVIIPSSDMSLSPVKYVFVEHNVRTGDVLVSWIGEFSEDEDLYHFVVFWCKSTEKSSCESNVEWTLLPGNRSSATVSITGFDRHKLLIGVSRFDQQGNYSEIKFADCVFPSSLDTGNPVVKLVPGKGDTDLSAFLITKFCEYESLPLEYMLFYGENKWIQAMKCDDITQEMQLLNFSATFEMSEVPLKGLEAGTEYVVCMKVLMRNGKYRMSDRISARVPDKDNTTLVLSLSVGLTLFLTFVIFIICWLKKHYVDIDVAIEVPEMYQYQKIPGLEKVENDGFNLEEREKKFDKGDNFLQLNKKADDSGNYSSSDHAEIKPESISDEEKDENSSSSDCSYMSVDCLDSSSSSCQIYRDEDNYFKKVIVHKRNFLEKSKSDVTQEEHPTIRKQRDSNFRIVSSVPDFRNTSNSIVNLDKISITHSADTLLDSDTSEYRTVYPVNDLVKIASDISKEDNSAIHLDNLDTNDNNVEESKDSQTSLVSDTDNRFYLLHGLLGSVSLGSEFDRSGFFLRDSGEYVTSDIQEYTTVGMSSESEAIDSYTRVGVVDP